MSILIRGIEMPKEYGRCMVIFPDGRVTTEFGSQVIATAVPIPPHGRLIDADAFEKKNAYFWGMDFIGAKYEDCLCDLINDAPTIIPADGKDTDVPTREGGE